MHVLDVHHHTGNLRFSLGPNRQVDYPRPWESFDQEEYEARLKIMDEAGIDRAVVMPVNRYLTTDGIAATRQVNDAIARYRDHDPARFVAAFGIAEPLHGDAGLDEITRIHDELGLVGVSYHSRWQGVATNDPWVLRHVEHLLSLRMLPMVHAHAESNLEAPSMVGHLARAVPEIPLLVTDALSTVTHIMTFLDVAQQYDNVYLETSLVSSPAMLRQIVAALGADRVVFGSDTYSYNMVSNHTPGVIRSLGLPADDVDKILRGNTHKLLAWTGAALLD